MIGVRMKDLWEILKHVNSHDSFAKIVFYNDELRLVINWTRLDMQHPKVLKLFVFRS